MVMDKIALLLVIIGAVNWGLIGIFQFDLVASIFGGQAAVGDIAEFPAHILQLQKRFFPEFTAVRQDEHAV